jgi:S1-C subfamily serine protease
VPWDDDADDDPTRLGPPLPPDDRLWRHPSELGGTVAAPAAGTGVGRGVTWPAVLVAACAGALLAVGALAVTGGMPARIVEHPVVEKVAMTPVVSSPMVRGDRGVDAVTAQVGPAVVRLDIEGAESTTSVSGVLFRDDGLILTSAHPLRGQRSVSTVLADGRRLDGEVVGLDAATDVAVVRIDGERLPVAVLGTSEALRAGTTTVAIGAPLGEGGAFTATGVVSAVSRKVATTDGRWLHGMIQTDAPIAPGCVGGPLVDTTGAVIGIMTSLAEDRDHDFAYAMPIDLAHRVAQQLVDGGRAVHGWLGIAGADLTAAQIRLLGVDAGAVVQEVAAGSPAAAAGLQPGDVITDIDGRAVPSMSILVVELRDRQPGEQVVVRYWRAGRPTEAPVTLADPP